MSAELYTVSDAGAPSLVLYLAGNHRISSPAPCSGTLLAPSLAEIRAKHPRLRTSALCRRRMATIAIPLSTDLIDRYNDDLDAYYERYRQYLDRLAEWERQAALTGGLNLTVANSGPAPAIGVAVVVKFPTDVALLEDNPVATLPRPPRPPRLLPRFAPAEGGLSAPSARLPANARDATPAAADRWLAIDPELREAAFAIPALARGSARGLPRVFFRFPSNEAVRSFPITYRISAAGLHGNAAGRLEVGVAD